ELKIPVPSGRAGTIAVNCRFTYDINGILEVDLHVPATGERRELLIVDDPDAIDPLELERRRKALASLKVHPRDEQTNLAIIARMERCYEQALGESREMIGQWMLQFAAALEGQNPRVIADARAKLTQALDSIEGESYL